MNVLMVSSETVPFSKSGGLADVVGALSPALSKRGSCVKIAMPMYGFIPRKGFKKELTVKVKMLSSEESVDIMKKETNGCEYLAFAHPVFTARNGIYGNTSFTPYADNCPRYLLFAKAIIAYLKESKWKADVIHAHDWCAGPCLYLAKKERLKAKTVFTIHNLAYQGEFSRYDMLLGAIEPTEKMFSGNGVEKKFNMLKTGLEYADAITTVSESYSKEIQTPQQGCGLDLLLQSKKDLLHGIVNGIDYDEWNPAKDSAFREHFTPENLAGKAKLKRRVQKEFGLEVRDDVPLFAMITRIADQKGFADLLGGDYCALERLVNENDIQFCIIGTGDKRYEEKLKGIASRHPNLSVNILFNVKASHILEGGADFFLMPSKYEPCGLNQMYSLHYGTLPVAHRTGGLADTITDYDEDIINGDGFLFDNLSGEDIEKRVKRAAEFYRNDKKELAAARARAMRKDFTWSLSATKYENIYNSITKEIQTK